MSIIATDVHANKDVLFNLLEGVAKNVLDNFKEGALGFMVNLCGPILKDLDNERASSILSSAVEFGYDDATNAHRKHSDEDILALALALPAGCSLSQDCWQYLYFTPADVDVGHPPFYRGECPRSLYDVDFVRKLLDIVATIESDPQDPLCVSRCRGIESVAKIRLAMTKVTAIRFDGDIWQVDSFAGLLGSLLRGDTQNRSVKCLHIHCDLQDTIYVDNQRVERAALAKDVAAALAGAIGQGVNRHIEELSCTAGGNIVEHRYVHALFPIMAKTLPNLKTIRVAGKSLSAIMSSLIGILSRGKVEELSIDDEDFEPKPHDILNALEQDGMAGNKLRSFASYRRVRVSRSDISKKSYEKELLEHAKQLIRILQKNTVLEWLTLQQIVDRRIFAAYGDVFDVVEVDRNGEEIRLGRTIQLQLALNRCGRGAILHGGSSVEHLLAALSNVETDAWVVPFPSKESDSSDEDDESEDASVKTLEENEKSLRIIDLTFSFLRVKPDLWVWHAVAQNN